MNLMLIFALVAAGSAVAAVAWAFRERVRAQLAEALLESQGDQKGQVAAQISEVAEAILRKNDEAMKSREELAQAKLAAQLAPVAKTLKEFQEHVVAVEKARNEDTGNLKAQIGQMITVASATREETLKLTNALKRGAGIQGRWGEQMLRNVLELAGLRPGVDFDEQVYASDADGVARPDVVVRLPGASFFVIDSKVSTTDYEAFLSAQDDLARETALKAHCESIRRHVAQLSSKAYWTRFDKPPASRSPDIVVMFVPLESAYACAVERMPSLVVDAWDRKVAIVTPSALFPLLKAVAYGWRAEDQAANAREIAEAGRELHKRVSVIAKYAADLGVALDRAVNHYNDFVGSLERNVVSQAKRFESLAAQSERTIADTPTLDAHTRQMVKLVEKKGNALAAQTATEEA
jgi:DNA recombination protein RmuC